MTAHLGMMLGVLFVALLLIVPFPHAPLVTGATVGVAYGRLGNNLPSPAEVVSLLQANNFKNAMIYDTDSQVLEAFMGSGISLIVQASNGELQGLASSQGTATQWVQNNILPYASTIKYIAVGNEVLTADQVNAQFVYEAMNNIYNALVLLNLQEAIKVSTTHAANVLDASSFPPSNGHFSGSIMQQMASILGFLSATGAPFMANVYPFLAYIGSNGAIRLPYALLQSGVVVVPDSGSGLVYTNLFDAQVDTLIVALEKLGFGNIPLVVTETGWPSGGDPSATVGNAQAYNGNLVAHLATASGTPKRPGMSLETYIFALFNENQKTGADYERHFGLFNPDQTKVYNFSL